MELRTSEPADPPVGRILALLEYLAKAHLGRRMKPGGA